MYKNVSEYGEQKTSLPNRTMFDDRHPGKVTPKILKIELSRRFYIWPEAEVQVGAPDRPLFRP
jgi:hypothetical protein